MIHVKRLSWDMFFMLQAHLVATRATCDRGPELLLDPGRHGVGCVIAKNKRLIATGYAGSPPGQKHCDDAGHMMSDGHCVRTIHSEMNAIMQCALDETSPKGATLFTTASPCFDCAKAIIRAGISRVVYGAFYDSRYDLSDTSFSLLMDAGVELTQIPLRIWNGQIRNVTPKQKDAPMQIVEGGAGLICLRCANELKTCVGPGGVTAAVPCQTCCVDYAEGTEPHGAGLVSQYWSEE